MTDPAAPTPAPYAAAPAVPGKTLGIVGLVLAFVMPLLGLILSIVAKVQSHGAKNTPATVGIVLSIIFIVVYIGIIIAVVAGLAAGCSQYGPGVHDLSNGTTLTCS